MTASASYVTTPWRLEGHAAHYASSDLEAVVDVRAPTRGLAQLRFRGAAVDGSLLGVDAATEASDAYVRGSDLVVAYRETSDNPYSVQVYWSVADASRGGALIIDATVSIQTRQWQAYPRVVVASSLAGAGITRVDRGLPLWRIPDVDWSYAELTAPGDFIPGGDFMTASWTFANHFMERGVIRRLRIRGVLVPRRDDAARADAVRTEWLAENPPLTA